MPKAWDEGIRRINNIPQSLECLIQYCGVSKNDWHGGHYHDYIELIYAFEGSCTGMVDEQEIHVPQGALLIIQPGEAHEFRCFQEPQKRVCFKFLPQILYSAEQTVTELVDSMPYVFEHFGQQRVFLAEELADTFIPAAIEDACREKLNHGFGYELAIRTQVMRIFLWIIRAWHRQEDSPNHADTASAAALIHRARDYVRDNLASASMETAARACGLSYGYFSRLFSTHMKMGFTAYVNRERVVRSLQLLAATDMSITDIAMRVGFSTTSYYIQVFKRDKGISPSQFRRLSRAEGSSTKEESV